MLSVNLLSGNGEGSKGDARQRVCEQCEDCTCVRCSCAFIVSQQRRKFVVVPARVEYGDTRRRTHHRVLTREVTRSLATRLPTFRSACLSSNDPGEGPVAYLDIIFTAPVNDFEDVRQAISGCGCASVLLGNEISDLATMATPAAVYQANPDASAVSVQSAATVSSSFMISGMSCASCVRSIESLLKARPGVDRGSVAVSLLPQRVVLSHDSNIISPDEIARIIKDAGFNVVSRAIVEQRSANIAHVTLSVQGMTCASCVSAVENALGRQPGVKSVSASLLSKSASIDYDPSKVGVRDLIAFVDDCGYEASISTAGHTRSGDPELRLYRHKMLIALGFAIPTFVFGMVPMFLPQSNAFARFLMDDILPGVAVHDVLLWILSTPVQFWLGRGFYIHSWKSITKLKTANMDVLVALGTTISYVFSVYAVIVNLATGAHLVDQYFETSVFLIFFILLGKFLEALAKGRLSQSISRLMALSPGTATLVLSFENPEAIMETIDIPIDLVQVGDVVQVHAGARVPSDGVVVSGSSYVNESMLTGESIPVAKEPGDEVLGGTINETGTILVKVTRAGPDTALARIISLVENAQSSKAKVQIYADRISAVFVPFVLVVSLLTFLAWGSLATTGSFPSDWIPPGRTPVMFAVEFAVSVLVIACPCALGLATPTAIMVATGIAARHGVLLKGGGAALETARKVKILAFDKTGTLTQGRPKVIEAWISDDVCHQFPHIARDKASLWALLGTAASLSSHPLSRAVVDHVRSVAGDAWSAPAAGCDVSGSREVPGKGLIVSVKARVDDAFEVIIGSQSWLSEHGCVVNAASQDLRAHIEQWQTLGRSLVLVGISWPSEQIRRPGMVLAGLAIADPIRTEAPSVVSSLSKRGISVWMLTGDNDNTAQTVAHLIGIPPNNVISQVLPGDKAECVRSLQLQGEVVGMVGDGINDAIALAQADLGIAIGTGSDVAMESGQIILVKSDLRDVEVLLDLSRRTFSRIRWNFTWAFGFNCVGIPVAAGVLYPWLHVALVPWMAGLAMALSSVSVTVNSLLLELTYRIDR